MKKLLVGFSLFVLSFTSVGRDFYVKNAALDVQRYRFSLELNDENDQIKGVAIISLKAKSVLNEFQIDLGQIDSSGKGMRVTSIESEGKALPINHVADKLHIVLPNHLEANSVINLKIAYEGVPKSGLHISKNKFGDRVFFADNWPDQGHHWLPSIDHPSDKAAVEFVVTAPAHYAVVANGLKIEESNLENNRKLTHWREDVPIAVKVMVIGVARFAMQESARLNDISVSSWVFPQNRTEGFYDYSPAVNALEFFQKNVGPYPYKKLANVQSKTRFGGLENANTIFYFENSVNGKGEQEALIAHEIAHQWFGNSTTENDWHHVWLSEGFASYFTNLYLEHTYGRERFVKQLLLDREKVIRYHQKTVRPIVDVTIQDPKNVLSPNTYEKAAWVLHMLRQQLGDERFWNGIQAYYKKFAGGNVLSGDFQSVMEQVSGKDLNRFFQQWLYQAGYPLVALDWAWQKNTQTLTMKIEQRQVNAKFDFPIEILIQKVDGSVEVASVEVRQGVTDYSIKMKDEVKLLSLDPMVKLLFEGVVTHR
ncbi:M1 family metallopeptidase [Undibacterium fentianense]|uniref:Aminopeptidase N n=1 Tax=Undibacterium fentianense TaxID=2828728 RepID=A0A941DYY8_9BURK|nr:M1 family metallopeptidase [Undibacterium fentianense]MBR7800034.1 M1 family metallopeptidase [Undibacterium fentianense]